jgi:hypothetical protein
LGMYCSVIMFIFILYSILFSKKYLIDVVSQNELF